MRVEAGGGGVNRCGSTGAGRDKEPQPRRQLCARQQQARRLHALRCGDHQPVRLLLQQPQPRQQQGRCAPASRSTLQHPPGSHSSTRALYQVPSSGQSTKTVWVVSLADTSAGRSRR